MSAIQTNFSNENAKTNFAKLDTFFINTFYSFLKSINCTSITLTSTFREGTESSHSYGLAVDVDNIVANGKIYLFNMWYGQQYSDSDDETFFNLARKFFGKTLHNYYSPAIIMHAGSNPVSNSFRYVTDKKSVWEKAGKIDPDKRTIEQQHVNHLHIAVDPNGRIPKKNHTITKESDGIFTLIFSLAFGFGIYYYFSNNKNEKEVNPEIVTTESGNEPEKNEVIE
ncbi:MAG: hypothetical protein IPL26_30055 [Leptospiraceae bacterium]|nr:hypothetical protein [Leptospiraceae bacterium]